MFWWILGGVVLLLLILSARAPKPPRWRDPRPDESERVEKGHGLGLEELARRLAMGERELQRFSPVYSTTTIPKRTGGTRTLHVPDDKTKELQRKILRQLLARLRAHEAACGFERGKSIVHNALPHVGQCVVIHLDVVDFFPSTGAGRVDRYFRRVGWDAECAAILTKLVTHHDGLPQGAPTSPRLSNLVNFHLDVQLTRLAAWRRGSYTRYADDITLSFPQDYPKKMRGIVQKARRLLKASGYTMHLRKKLSIRRSHQRQSVTGLVVNDHVQLPREIRRWLRAVRHRVATGREATLTPAQLAGWTALEEMIRKQSATGA